MAVQKSRKSRARRGTRRAHDSLTAMPLTIEKATGEPRRLHHISADGYYRGRKVVVLDRNDTKQDA